MKSPAILTACSDRIAKSSGGEKIDGQEPASVPPAEAVPVCKAIGRTNSNYAFASTTRRMKIPNTTSSQRERTFPVALPLDFD
jgi:hypothetical protein